MPPPFPQMCAQSYIAVVVAKMEFSGRGHECPGRVKGAIENKIVTTAARNRAVVAASYRIRSFVAAIDSPERKYGRSCSDASQSRRVNACGRLSTSPQFRVRHRSKDRFDVSGACGTTGTWPFAARVDGATRQEDSAMPRPWPSNANFPCACVVWIG